MAFKTYTISGYIESKEKLADRIKAIDELIDKLLLSMLSSTVGAGAGIGEYWLDDGQVKIKTQYRSVDEIAKGVKALERIKNTYINKYNGRHFVLRDEKVFRR